MAEWTTEPNLGPSAKIPAVWYTRLMVSTRGDVYLRKVVRDIRAGASDDLVEAVLGIADRFGTRDEVADRIARVREILAEA